MHGVHADGIGQRHQNRGYDDQRGGDIHHHADEKQKTHDHCDDHIRVVRHGPHLGGDGLRNLIEAQPPAQNGGKPDDDKDHTRDPRGAHKHFVHVLNADVAVNENTDKERIGDSDRCRLGWCDDATKNATKNDHRHDQGQDRPFEFAPHIYQRSTAFGGRQVIGICAQTDHHHADQTNHKARQNTRRE